MNFWLVEVPLIYCSLHGHAYHVGQIYALVSMFGAMSQHEQPISIV